MAKSAMAHGLQDGKQGCDRRWYRNAPASMARMHGRSLCTAAGGHAPHCPSRRGCHGAESTIAETETLLTTLTLTLTLTPITTITLKP